jgi:hypothetical protein
LVAGSNHQQPVYLMRRILREAIDRQPENSRRKLTGPSSAAAALR